MSIDESRTVVTHGHEWGRMADRLQAAKCPPKLIVELGKRFERGRDHIEVTIADTVNLFDLALYFEHAGRDAPFVGFKVGADDPDTQLDPAAFAGLARRLPYYVQYARAEIAWSQEDAEAAMEALRGMGTSPRGKPDSFYRALVAEFRQLVADDHPHPIKTLAERHSVHKSRPSRWLNEAEQKGFLDPGERQRA